ncbi:unnamed protein product [Phytomonas sp. Hart1]|nr:unnamed protein product [Phytomonas sp. Hart1]|eukprot:CCW67821.1 unnamed protein product [Phytomonas sp. isolate Hart1]
MEKEKGVEVLPMFDRSLNTELAKGQIGFIDFVSAKFFNTLVSMLCHDMQWCVDRINSNRKSWNALLEAK